MSPQRPSYTLADRVNVVGQQKSIKVFAQPASQADQKLCRQTQAARKSSQLHEKLPSVLKDEEQGLKSVYKNNDLSLRDSRSFCGRTYSAENFGSFDEYIKSELDRPIKEY